MTGRARTGDDPTRRRPGGSRTETRITEETELGSDGAGDDNLGRDDQRQAHDPRRTTPSTDG
jgi:hypothetical protein